MAPAAVRTPTRKALAALPETNRLRFLCAASKLLAEPAPEVSSYFGSRALQWADQKKLPAPKVPPGQLCHQCGAYCTATEASLVQLSSQCQRRRRHNKYRASEHKVAAVFSCQVCGCRLTRTFVDEGNLQKVFPSAKACRKLRAQQQASHRHLATKATMQQYLNSTQQQPSTSDELQLLLNKTPLDSLHSHTQAAPPETSCVTPPHLPVASCDKVATPAEHGGQQTSQNAEHDLPYALGTQESAQSAASWRPKVSLSTPSPLQTSAQPPLTAVALTEPGPSAADMQCQPAQPVSPMEDSQIALAVTQSSPNNVESTPKTQDQASPPSTTAASHIVTCAVSSKTLAVQTAHQSMSARDGACNSDRAEVGVQTAADGAEDTPPVAVDAAGAAGHVGGTDDTPPVPSQYVTSSIFAGQNLQSSLHKKDAAVAAIVKNGSGSLLSRDSSIAGVPDEAQQVAPTRPAAIVSQSSQNVTPAPMSKHKSKSAHCSWRKTGRVWKPKRLHASKSVRQKS